MSRCFPFPPPGYEKKPLTDDLDLLKKEKRKEKKHKKDKKDKEKKEGKEKRDKEKDRSEGKHKDKKDKHRDKKKEKDKGSSKTSTQDEGYNGEKLPLHNNHIHIHNKEQQIQDKKQPPPPPLHFRNGESTKDNRTSSSSSHSQGQNGDLARNRDSENLKFVQELDRRIRDEEKGTGSQQFLLEGRRNSFNNKVEMQNPIPRNKINGATPPPPPLQPPQLPLQPPQPPLQPPLENKIERRFDQKEKVQESDDKRGDKRKHKDRDKQRAGKEKDKLKEKSDKEKKKHIKKSSSSDLSTTTTMLNNNNLSSSHILENSEGMLKKRKDLETNGVLLSHEIEPRPNKMARPISNISPENGRKLDFPQIPSSSFLDNQKASSQSSQDNFKTGIKSQKVNGIISSPPFSLPTKKPPIPISNHIHHKPSPIKSPPPPLLPQPSPPPPVITNHIAALSPPVKPQLPVPIPARQPVSRPKPPPAVVAAPPPPPPKKVEKVKPPHPDVKYLKQILSVPKPEEWGGFDEQEWLMKAGPPRGKAAEVAEEEVQVWSEAKQIDSVDVCALPYVIPY